MRNSATERSAKQSRVSFSRKHMDSMWPFDPAWKRPQISVERDLRDNPKATHVDFMMTEIDLQERDGEPIIRMYGLT